MGKKKEVKIPIAIFIVILLIIILGGFAIAYFFTDVFKSDKEIFFKYFANNSELFEIFEDSDLEAYKNKQETTGYSNEGILTMSYTGDYNEELGNALQNTNITFSGDTDKYANYKYETVSFNYSDTDSLTLRYINMDDYYGIKIDDVLKKYIALENNNLTSWLTELGLVDEEYASLIPDKIDLTEYESIEIFTDEEKETLKEKYKSLLLENLSDESFAKSDTETGTKYTLTLTENEQMQLVYNMLEQVKNDETIIAGVKKVLIENVECTEEEATEYINEIIEVINDLQEEIQDELSEIETDTTTDDTFTDSTTSEDTVLDTSDSSTTTTTSTDNNIYISVYVESKELTKTEIVFGDEVSFVINKDGSSYSFELNELDSTESDYAKVNLTKNKTDDNLEYIVSVSYQDENIVDCTINFNGINTLSTVTESFTLAINYDSNNLNYSYSDTITFGSITQEDITVDEMLFLNSTTNIDNITNLLTTVSEKVEEMDDEYTANLGLDESPAIYYIPAAIPFMGMMMIENDSGILNLGGGILTSALGILVYNNASSTISSSLTSDSTTDSGSTDTDDTQSTEAETSTSSEEAEAFNSSYENYVGTSLSVANIRAIYSLVIGNNETETTAGTNHIVTINGEQVESTPEDLTTDTTYTVSLEYDDSGYVCNVIYKDNNETLSSSIKATEIAAYNSKFTQYMSNDEMVATEVTSLINAVQASNESEYASGSDRYVSITVKTSSGTNIYGDSSSYVSSTTVQTVPNSTTYKYTCEYDSNGIINSIYIEPSD